MNMHWPEGACWKGNFCIQENWFSSSVSASAIKAGRDKFMANGWTCDYIAHCASKGFKGPSGSGKGTFNLTVFVR